MYHIHTPIQTDMWNLHLYSWDSGTNTTGSWSEVQLDQQQDNMVWLEHYLQINKYMPTLCSLHYSKNSSARRFTYLHKTPFNSKTNVKGWSRDKYCITFSLHHYLVGPSILVQMGDKHHLLHFLYIFLTSYQNAASWFLKIWLNSLLIYPYHTPTTLTTYAKNKTHEFINHTFRASTPNLLLYVLFFSTLNCKFCSMWSLLAAPFLWIPSALMSTKPDLTV